MYYMYGEWCEIIAIATKTVKSYYSARMSALCVRTCIKVVKRTTNTIEFYPVS